MPDQERVEEKRGDPLHAPEGENEVQTGRLEYPGDQVAPSPAGLFLRCGAHVRRFRFARVDDGAEPGYGRVLVDVTHRQRCAL
jgi:hypothetical protein